MFRMLLNPNEAHAANQVAAVSSVVTQFFLSPESHLSNVPSAISIHFGTTGLVKLSFTSSESNVTQSDLPSAIYMG